MLTMEKTSSKAADGNSRVHWPAEMQKDFTENEFNGCVGSVLVSETDRVRVWHLTIPPGKRCNFHRHVLNYFWSALVAGQARNFYEDGTERDFDYYRGETRHLDFAKGEYMVHAVENLGKTDLLFTTVEFLDSPNAPLPIPEAMRLKAPS